MNRPALWTVTDAMRELLEVMTWLEEDPNYTKADAVDGLHRVFEHLDHLYEIAKETKHEPETNR